MNEGIPCCFEDTRLPELLPETVITGGMGDRQKDAVSSKTRWSSE
jgi:hypothetical protein